MGIISIHFVFLSKIGRRTFLKYRSELHSRLLLKVGRAVMAHQSFDREGAFKRLSRINTALIPSVPGIDMPTQMKPSFVSETRSFGTSSPSFRLTARRNQLLK
jgi:hypothetical protein